jgi:phage tail sheath protein FI
MEAKVTLREIDRSIRVPSFAGVSGAIVVEATKGPTVPTLVTNETQLINRYTPNAKIEVGYDLGYYSALAFLERSTSLWFRRLVKDGLFGGAVLRASTSVNNNFALPSGLTDPSAYNFDGSIDSPALAQIRTIETVADVSSSLNNTHFLISSTTVSYYVWFNVNGAGVDPAIAGRTGVEVAISEDASDVDVALAITTALDLLADFGATSVGNLVTITNANTGVVFNSDVEGAGTSGFTLVVTQLGAALVDVEDEVILIYQANEGNWGNDIAVKIVNYVDNVDLVKQPDTFAIQVFKLPNTNVPVETHFCSRNPSALNGFRRNIFIENVLQSSNYIRAISNPVIDSSVQPKSQSVALTLVGGDDGVTAGVSDRIQAVQDFANPEAIRVTLLMDGGYAVPAYAQALTSIAQNRRDCVAILSVPFAAEDSSDYLNDLSTYVDSTLNINSSWAALYSGYCLIQDRYNEREIFVSPDGYAAQAISSSAANFELWFPPAGFRRGILTTVLDVKRRYTEGERDLLYDKRINPIRFFEGRGIVIWGQKTLQAQPSALDRLNVRLLLIVIGPALKAFLENFLFELNDPETREEAIAGIVRYMDNIQSRRGVTAYLPVIDDTNNTAQDVDANRLVVDLYISPTRSIEDIPLTFIITASDAL